MVGMKLPHHHVLALPRCLDPPDLLSTAVTCAARICIIPTLPAAVVWIPVARTTPAVKTRLSTKKRPTPIPNPRPATLGNVTGLQTRTGHGNGWSRVRVRVGISQPQENPYPQARVTNP
jgi:hypothetical protein